MDSMSRSQPGKVARFAPPDQKDLFEIVPESRLDFAFYKDRSELGTSMVGTVKFTEGLWTLLASGVQRQKVSSEEAVQPIALALLALRLLLQVFEAWIGKPLPHDMKALSASRSIAALPHEDGRCTRPAARASIHY